ncbi:MAG: hypothetical protein JWO31_1299 [Phycisphaerales bacterium]|nr:hypothetical protein [Phycisphaerales bacterium]
MPPWLRTAVQAETHLDFPTIAVRLVVAFAFGCMTAGIHYLTADRADPTDDPDAARSLTGTLVLLSMLIALVTVVIGDNVARAFSLVGALAIVRFRTVVPDTRDTAFVMFSVITGMAAGTGHLLGPLVCAPLVLLAAWAFRRRHSSVDARRAGKLVIRLAAGRSPDDRLGAALKQHLGTARLTGVATARGGAALDATYAVTLPPADQAYAMMNELSRVDGVQGVEMKED